MVETCLLSFLLTATPPPGGLAESPGRAPVSNSSFESSDEPRSGPFGWRFFGSPEAVAGAWTREDPFHNERAARIDGRYGTQHWQSDPIGVRESRKYLLGWSTRFFGEKSWRFRAEFCGVEIEFRDANGRPLATSRQHTHCWQTPGWQPAWFLFETPKDSRSLVIRFALRTDAPLPGGFDVDAVRLGTYPPESASGSAERFLSLRIADERGRPTAARIRIVNRQDETMAAPGAISYAQNGGAFHPLEEGACHLSIPPGRYRMTVAKGFEYRPWVGEVDVQHSDRTVRLALERACNWQRRGWYSGDHHTHLHRHGGSLFPSLTWRDVLRAARSEGLDFLPFMGADHYPADTAKVPGELRRDDFVAELTDEITDDFWGHVCPIGFSRDARDDPRYDAGPMNFDRDAATAGSGGVLCYAHPYGPMESRDPIDAIADPAAGLIAREFPIDLALGMPCTIDLLTTEGRRNQLELKLRDVYRLYNMGFRPALTASTDFHVDQGRQVIGAVRTYVRSESLDLTAIAAAYRAGRTFATNGPLLDLRVAGAAPGDEVHLGAAGGTTGSVRAEVEAVSIGRLDRVEIVVNGETFRTFTSNEPHRIVGACDVTIRESTWIAAKVVGPEDAHLAGALEGRPLGAGQIAHTSPVYVVVDGKPVLAGRPADAEYFVRWCDAALGAWRTHLAEAPADARHDALVTERLGRAKAVFEQKKSMLKRTEEK